MTPLLINVLSFQIGWFGSVLGAGSGIPWLGPLIVPVLLAVHLWMVPDRRAALRTVLLVALIGVLVDSALGYAGLLQFHDGTFPAWICPPWLVGLWSIFATTLQHSLGWLIGRWRLAGLLGGILGPVSYFAGQQLGALRLGEPILVTGAVVATIWVAMLPSMLWVSDKVKAASVR